MAKGGKFPDLYLDTCPPAEKHDRILRRLQQQDRRYVADVHRTLFPSDPQDTKTRTRKRVRTMGQLLSEILGPLVERYSDRGRNVVSILDVGTGDQLLLHSYLDSLRGSAVRCIACDPFQTPSIHGNIAFVKKTLPEMATQFKNSKADIAIATTDMHHSADPETYLETLARTGKTLVVTEPIWDEVSPDDERNTQIDKWRRRIGGLVECWRYTDEIGRGLPRATSHLSGSQFGTLIAKVGLEIQGRPIISTPQSCCRETLMSVVLAMKGSVE